jgi:hypothetical protein
MPALGRLRQNVCMFKASLGYIVCLKEKRTKISIHIINHVS